MTQRPTLLFFLCSALGACTPGSPEPSVAPEPHFHGQQLTNWTDGYEFFVDCPILPAGEPLELAMHVATPDGAAAANGPIAIELAQGGEVVRVEAQEQAAEGIWLIGVSLPAEGNWALTADYSGVTNSLGDLLATSDHGLMEAKEAEGPSGDAIVVLKQQQWPARIQTAEVGTHELSERLPVVVHATPMPAASASLRAPSFGHLEAAEGVNWPRLGDAVKTGQLLGVVRMPLLPGDPATQRSAQLQAAEQTRAIEIGLLESEAALTTAEIRHENATQQLDRVRELHAQGARSNRELELAEAEFAKSESALRAAASSLDAWRKASDTESNDGMRNELLFELRAPCDGLVVEAAFAPGSWVDSEDELMHVVDTARLRYGVRMHVDDLARLDQPQTFVRLPNGNTMALPGPDGVLLLARPPVDPGSHVGELVYEAPAPDGLLPGAVLQAQVAVGAPREALAVPASAVVDEDGISVVFVQVGGEAFERRPVRLGLRGLDAVEVLEGVAAGERVVSAGAYTIRLASLSGAIPEHTH